MVWTETAEAQRGAFASFRDPTRVWSPLKDSLRSYSPLRETPREYFDCLEDTDCQDELFLLPEQVLEMDSDTVREDLCSIVPGFKKFSPHNSLDSSDSTKSLKLAEDSEGFHLARASDGCKTFWLCETGSGVSGMETGTGMPGALPANMSQSLDVHTLSQALDPGLVGSLDREGKMSSSMSSSTMSLNKHIRRNLIHRNATSQNWFCFDEDTSTEGRADLAFKERDREERIRRIKDQQEEERRKKLEELKQHAVHAQKFREQQEFERRRHIEDLRSRDMDRRSQVEERRREIERTEQDRREAILAKNRERDDRLEVQRRHSRGNLEFAFGSSAPRMVEYRDSAYWGSRSVYDRRSSERELDLKNKRTASAQALDRSNEGDEGGLSQLAAPPPLGAHRRRTDLIPTILMYRGLSTNPNTPGLSRENSTASRPSSAMSGAGRPQVRLRNVPNRRPRPLSIATTGMTGSNSAMTASMYEERQKPQLRNKSLATPKLDRMKRARSVTSEQNIEDDQRSNSSSVASGPLSQPVRPSSARKTPAQVKAEAAARRAKISGRSVQNAPKINSGSAPVSPAFSTDNLEVGGGEAEVYGDRQGEGKRQTTPDIIKNGKKEDVKNGDIEKEEQNEKEEKEKEEEKEEKEDKPEKKIITSEEQAKARIAEKRREMKEKMEREAEAERLRVEAEARAEEERQRAEEEEERRLEEETERLAAEARRVEEERIQKAIQEREAEEKRLREEEEKARREKEETERKTKEDAERREVELREKMRREEEERLVRKKRIEEIMARTRAGKGGTPNSTPKKEMDTETTTSQPPQQPPSLDTIVDPTKPDLLEDISDSVHSNMSDGGHSNSVYTENARNLQNGSGVEIVPGGGEGQLDAAHQNGGHTAHGDSISDNPHSELEKGSIDSLSNKSFDSEASIKLTTVHSRSLIDVENGSSKKSVLEVVEFDEIIELTSDNRTVPSSAPQPPIRAFEPSSPQSDLMS